MKKIILFITLLMAFCFTSCDSISSHFNKDDNRIDSLDVVNIVENTINPQFETIEGITKYWSKLVESHYEDSVFTSMPYYIFNDVVRVCLNKYNYVSKASVVKEYTDNIDVYTNLHKTVKGDEDKPQTIDEILDLKDSSKTDTIINTKDLLLIKTTK